MKVEILLAFGADMTSCVDVVSVHMGMCLGENFTSTPPRRKINGSRVLFRAFLALPLHVFEIAFRLMSN